MLQTIETPSYVAHHSTLPLLGHGQLCMATYGRFSSKGSFQWEQVSQNPCFHMITKGTGTFISNGRPQRAGPGSLYIFFPGDHILYHDDPGNPWQYRWFSISGPFMEILQDVGIAPGQVLHQIEDWSSIISSLDAIEEACQNDVSVAHLGCSVLHAILDQLGSTKLASTTLAHHARKLIDTWSYSFPSISELALSLGISRSTLFRCFKAEFGVSVKRYLDNRRLLKAKELLARSVQSISTIGQLCGYTDPLYFSRAFSKNFGLSPGQYRNRLLNKK